MTRATKEMYSFYDILFTFFMEIINPPFALLAIVLFIYGVEKIAPGACERLVLNTFFN